MFKNIFNKFILNNLKKFKFNNKKNLILFINL